MGLPIAPILIGAGVGALGGAVTGNNPFKTALLGAALGTGAGALGAGSAATTAGTAASAGTTGAASLAPTTASAFEASMGLPSSALLEAGAPLASAFPTGAGMGLTQTAGGTLINPEYYSNILGNQVYTGGEGLFSNAIGQMTPSLEDLKKYATIDNLNGAAGIMSKFQPTPRSPAPQGRVSQGQALQGGLGQGGVEGLLSELEKQRQTQRQPISLLVG
jgi:hypothetical protein